MLLFRKEFILSLFSLFFWTIGLHSANSSVDQAEAEWTKAQAEYSQKLQAIKLPTPEQSKKLEQEILVPAQRKLNQAYQAEAGRGGEPPSSRYTDPVVYDKTGKILTVGGKPESAASVAASPPATSLDSVGDSSNSMVSSDSSYSQDSGSGSNEQLEAPTDTRFDFMSKKAKRKAQRKAEAEARSKPNK